MEKYRVVFHLDEGGKAKGELVFKNIENLIADLGEGNVEVELVANAEGITSLLRSPNLHGELVQRLVAKGVRFVACANALRQMGLEKKELLDPVEIVSAGVAELVKRQAQGWAYVRP